MNSETNAHSDIEQAKINMETAKLPWSDLQRFFAAGQVYGVSPQHDLTEVALNMSQDNVQHIEELIISGEIRQVTDQQALEWIKNDALVWCVVVKPFVLVQGL